MNIARLFSTPTIEVEWDNVVQRSVKIAYQGTTHAQLPIRLFDLLLGLGSVQSKRAMVSS